jgi:hypothetical protein
LENLITRHEQEKRSATTRSCTRPRPSTKSIGTGPGGSGPAAADPRRAATKMRENSTKLWTKPLITQGINAQCSTWNIGVSGSSRPSRSHMRAVADKMSALAAPQLRWRGGPLPWSGAVSVAGLARRARLHPTRLFPHGRFPPYCSLQKNDVRPKTYVPRGTFFKNLRKKQSLVACNIIYVSENNG